MEYALLEYPEPRGRFNIGDYIQGVAARQYLPRVDHYLNRERLAEYDGPPAKLIMNGWFMFEPANWPPAPQLEPLYVSFHINDHVADAMLNSVGVAHLLRHAPIGCRDPHTCQLLQDRGIPAYYSGCLTLTLESRLESLSPRQGVYLVDPLFRWRGFSEFFPNPREWLSALRRGRLSHASRSGILSRVLSSEILEQATILNHSYNRPEWSRSRRHEEAQNLLRIYETAELVITSRIHCALPCLAYGTPVLFLDAALDAPTERCRLDGLTDMFPTIRIDRKGATSANFDVDLSIRDLSHLATATSRVVLASVMKQRCAAFIQSESRRKIA